MKYLVSGGAGFIGSHIVERLIADGDSVTVFDNFSTGHNIFNHPNVEYIQGDITDESSYAPLIGRKFDFAVHLAAAISVVESMTNPQKYQTINVGGSQKFYNFAAREGIKAVISASSAAVYGDCGREAIKECFPYGGISPYAQSKYSMEHLKIQGPNENQTKLLFCRFFNVYGPRQDPKSPYTGVMSAFMRQASSQSPVTVFGDGEQTRDFVFVGDLTQAVLGLLIQYRNITDGEVFNVGTGEETSINRLAKHVALLGNVDIQHLEERPGDIKYSRSSPAKINAQGWRAHTGLDHGIQLTWSWFKNGNSSEWK